MGAFDMMALSVFALASLALVALCHGAPTSSWESMRLLAIPGTLHQASPTHDFVQAASRTRHFNVSVADVGSLPLFNPDVTSSASVSRLKSDIAAADAVLIVADRLSGPLQNALDWGAHVQNAWELKPAVVVGPSSTSSGMGAYAVSTAAAEVSMRIHHVPRLAMATQKDGAATTLDVKATSLAKSMPHDHQIDQLLSELRQWVSALRRAAQVEGKKEEKVQAVETPAIAQSSHAPVDKAEVRPVVEDAAPKAAAKSEASVDSEGAKTEENKEQTDAEIKEGSQVKTQTAAVEKPKQNEEATNQGGVGILKQAGAKSKPATPLQQQIDAFEKLKQEHMKKVKEQKNKDEEKAARGKAKEAKAKKEEKEASSTPQDPNCMDASRECTEWASAGECESNADYMAEACRKSC